MLLVFRPAADHAVRLRLQVLGYMMEAGVEPSIATFNTMISAALSKQDYEMVLHLWGKMREVGVVPSGESRRCTIVRLTTQCFVTMHD